MSESETLSCAAKLARVVLDNCGPLSAAEVAEEAHLSESDASDALSELAGADLAECVCGLCESKQRVYALTADEQA
jgi:DNA-binding transcriptional regulator GbsR (MarR family)